MLKFEITDKEHVLFKVKYEEHKKDCKFFKNSKNGIPKTGAIGGSLTYNFTPTSIGTVVMVSCACGHEMDLTDYGEW